MVSAKALGAGRACLLFSLLLGLGSLPRDECARMASPMEPVSFTIELDRTTFYTFFDQAKSKWAIVEFFASWCPHCRNFRPTYDKISSLSAAYPETIVSAAIDCAVIENHSICELFEVRGYPTVRFGNPQSFSNKTVALTEIVKPQSRSVEDYTSWLVAHTGVDMTFPRDLDLNKLKEEWKPIKQQMEEAAKEAFVEAVPVPNVQSGKQEKSIKHENVPSTGHGDRKHPDIILATTKFLDYGVVAGSKGVRAALLEFLIILAELHVDAECREGSKRMIAAMPKLWPAKLSSPRNNEEFISFPICGDEAHIPVDWVECKGSKKDTRGYTCGLWMMFHMVTTRSQDSNAVKALLSIIGFIDHLFGCDVCRENFMVDAMKIDWGGISRSRDTVLWLWNKHNEVNLRLAKEEASGISNQGDPKFPKKLWPSQKACPLCYLNSSLPLNEMPDKIENIFNEEVVYAYLQNMYGDKTLNLTDVSIASRNKPHPSAGRHSRIGRIFLGFCFIALAVFVILNIASRGRSRPTPRGRRHNWFLPGLMTSLNVASGTGVYSGDSFFADGEKKL